MINKDMVFKVKQEHADGKPIGVIGWTHCHDENENPKNFSDRADIAESIIKGQYDYLLDE